MFRDTMDYPRMPLGSWSRVCEHMNHFWRWSEGVAARCYLIRCGQVWPALIKAGGILSILVGAGLDRTSVSWPKQIDRVRCLSE